MKKREAYRTKRQRGVPAFAAVFGVLFLLSALHLFDAEITGRLVPGGSGCPAAYAQDAADTTASAAAFVAASKVLFHPRCVNCHPVGDSPLQGEEGRQHRPNVKRGPEGTGTAGLRCSVCHLTANHPGPHTPPGAPGWKLPPQHMPLVFEKLTPRQLCLQLKDPSRNGNMTIEAVLAHVREAPLVLWAWNPGEGRNPVPIPHDEFVKQMTEWVKTGAACPE